MSDVGQVAPLRRLSVTPGRARWEVPQSLGAARGIEQELAGHEAIRSVRFNRNTGGILVLFELQRSADEIEGVVHQALLRCASASEGAPSPAPEQARPRGSFGLVVAAAAATVATVAGAPLLGAALFVPVAVARLPALFASKRSPNEEAPAERAPTLEGPTPERVSDVRSLILRSSQHRRGFAQASLLGLVSVGLNTSRILSFGALVNVAFLQRAAPFVFLQALGPLPTVLFLGGTIVFCTAASAWTGRRAQRIWWGLGRKIQHGLRVDLYDVVQRLEASVLDDKQRGELVTLLNEDVNEVRYAFDASFELHKIAAHTVIGFGALLVVSPPLAALAILPVPFLVGLGLAYFKRLKDSCEGLRRHSAELGGLMTSNLEGVMTIRSFRTEGRELLRVVDASRKYWRESWKSAGISSHYFYVIEATLLAGQAPVVLMAAKFAAIGRISLGRLTSSGLLTANLLFSYPHLGQTLFQLERGLVSFSRTRRLAELPTEGQNDAVPTATLASFGDVRFEHVNFSYRTTEHPILQDLSVVFKRGETTAVVGPTGSGKSSLFKLLLRFYTAGQGTISIGGVDVREISRGDLRRSISLVSQDAFLFRETIRNNITIGRPGASHDDIVRVAKLACAHDFIERLPHGYDTVIGESGQTLSGGEAQRISIARALLKDAPLLILDEATSHLDVLTESSLLANLRELGKGRTIIAIAHRLHIARFAHRVHVVSQGRVVESGHHDELYRASGPYRELWDARADTV